MVADSTPDKYLVRRVSGVKLCYRLFVLFGPKDHIVHLSLLCSVIIFIHFKALRKRTHCYNFETKLTCHHFSWRNFALR